MKVDNHRQIIAEGAVAAQLGVLAGERSSKNEIFVVNQGISDYIIRLNGCGWL
ncbi:MAG: hypothetical protein HYY41_07440 [Chloroflexi bacterium]|nr:hypothetical protein [Chloroflexota bacterium]MBI2980632.1 hypothetical protein [Chloroflexota bacterium]